MDDESLERLRCSALNLCMTMALNETESLRYAAAILESAATSLTAVSEVLHRSGEPGIGTDVRSMALDCRGALAQCRRSADARAVQEVKRAMAKQETVTP